MARVDGGIPTEAVDVVVLAVGAAGVVGSRQVRDALDFVEQRADVDLGSLLDEDDAVFGSVLDLILLRAISKSVSRWNRV